MSRLKYFIYFEKSPRKIDYWVGDAPTCLCNLTTDHIE